jgi:hypothetical protein
MKSLLPIALLPEWLGVAPAQQRKRVDDAALTYGCERGEEWISYNVNWSEQRYSPLNQSAREPADAGPVSYSGSSMQMSRRFRYFSA